MTAVRWALGIARPDVELTFHRPAAPVSANQGGNWHRLYRARRPWKNTVAYLLAEHHEHDARVLDPRPIEVLVTIPFTTPRNRDPHNFVGSVVKGAVDGITAASWVPDDNAGWVTVLEPVLTVHPTDLTARLLIRDRGLSPTDTQV